MKYLPILLFFLLCKCSSHDRLADGNSYELILENGVYVEKFDSSNTSENRYTDNNLTYIAGNKLTYDYYYENKERKRFKFQGILSAGGMPFDELEKAWLFVPIDSLTDARVENVIITVEPGIDPMLNHDGTYNQTTVAFTYPRANDNGQFRGKSGVKDNEKNVWIHPPREKFFRILELNPFPYIRAPYKVGHKWKWSLKIGSAWGDERWKTWEGPIENLYDYEIVAKKQVETKIGVLECYEIVSTATSRIGQTHLTALFSPKVGFVMMDYTNIDSTKTVLELIAFERGGSGE